jgi:DNA mismatch repair protein MutL
MADIIQLLPDHVANQIAAGEVVQRPSSVVKELLENAIDAEANEVKLIVKDAGKTLIQVIDNGIGMSGTDARLSFERHATSKILNADDLYNLHTKGFRGEALASIAAISHVDLKTKQQADEIGVEIKIEGSVVKSQEVSVHPKGTSVAVKNLFFNIPARRKFLKSNPVETRHIIDEFHRIALAHPDVSFSMFHNGNELFNLPSSNYRQRIVNIFGGKTNEKLVPVNEETDVLKVSGFVVKPEFAKKTRGEQFLFVNSRFIRSAYLNHSINSAFEGLLQKGKHASYFLYLTVDPKTIDINIHPTKTEIKFDDEHTLYAILRSAVKHSLGQFNVAPVLDFDRDSSLDMPYTFKGKGIAKPNIEVDRNFNPFKGEGSSSGFSPNYKKEATGNWESLYVGLESKSNDPDKDQSDIDFEIDEITPSMFDAHKSKKVQKTFQLHNKYIVNTIKSGMLVIHQSRAHQRILYEDFLQHITVKEAVSQQLLFPLKLEFSSSEIGILKGLRDELEQTGFVFSKMEDFVELTGVPISVNNDNASMVLEHLINDVEHEVPESHFSPSDLLSKSLAKSLAVKSGQRLTTKEQEFMVNRLFACKESGISPTNRPTFITMSMEELDRKFL